MGESCRPLIAKPRAAARGHAMSSALFLALDGLDGTGKSTQCRLLADWLRRRGQPVVTCAEPGGTALGNLLRDLLLHHPCERTSLSEAFLFMASRAQLVAEVIQPALAAGNIVISDRFLLSTVVYQGHAGGLDPDMLWQVGRIATGSLDPNRTLVLDLPPDLAQARRAGPADRVESRGLDFHARVRTGFLAEAQRYPERIRVIDATPSIEIVHRRICDEIEASLVGTESSE